MLDKFIIPQIEWFLKWLMFSKIKEIKMTNHNEMREEPIRARRKCVQPARETAQEKIHCLIVLVLNWKNLFSSTTKSRFHEIWTKDLAKQTRNLEADTKLILTVHRKPSLW